MGVDDPAATRHEIAELTARLDELTTVLEAQRAELARLRCLVGHDEVDGRARPSTTATGAATDADDDDDDEARSTRRQLMGRGVAAVGAVAVGTAVAVGPASPAAAASGSFDGDPALIATAAPGSGTAIQATSGTGFAIYASSTASYSVFAEGAPAGLQPVAKVLNFGATGANLALEATTDSPGGTAVLGQTGSGSGTGVGVRGLTQARTGTGVQGEAGASDGSGIGVAGSAASPLGTGVAATHTGAGVALVATSGGSQIRLGGTPPAPTSGTHTAGELRFDATGDLWVCVASGTPGTWRRLAGPSTAGAFVALPTPRRVYDSRPGFNPPDAPKTPLEANQPREVDCRANGSGVPTGAVGVLVNLVAVNPTGDGFMSIYRAGIPWPGTSNLNYGIGQTVGVTTFSAVNAKASVEVRSKQSCDVVVDVLGYYA